MEEAAIRIVEDGAALRTKTRRERAAFAPEVDLPAFEAAMREVGADRHVALREVAVQVDRALAEARTDLPALRALRLYLAATLCHDPHEAAGLLERTAGGRGEDALGTTLAWLTADLALAARRSTTYEASWATAVRISSDPLSRVLAGLTTGAMRTNSVASALAEEPWALALTLAMTTEPEHASALLDCGAQAQAERRAFVVGEAGKWSDQTMRVSAIERRLEIEVKAFPEAREGFRAYESLQGGDLFSLWNAVALIEEGRAALADATESAITAEASRRREAMRRGKAALERVREAYDTLMSSAKDAYERRVEAEATSVEAQVGDGSATQKACVYGFGTGCSVVAAYLAAGVALGAGGLVGKMGPLVMAVAALPALAAVAAQASYLLKRSSAQAASNDRRSMAMRELDLARAAAEREHGAELSERRRTLEEAEASLAAYEKVMASSLRRVR